MPELNSKPPIASTLATLAGCVIVSGSLLLICIFPQLHVGVAIAIGTVLGIPPIALGLRLHPSTSPDIGSSKQFFPTRAELPRTLWGVLGFLTILACFLAPLCVFGPLLFFLPSGDGWLIVTARLICVLLAIGGSIWWFKFATKTFPERFRGKVSDKVLDALVHEEPEEEPADIRTAILKNWQVAMMAVTGFCVAFGIVDFDNPLLDLDAGPKRFRGITLVLAWCRGNPNTVASCSWLVGVGAMIDFARRIRRAHLRGQMTPPKNGV